MRSNVSVSRERLTVRLRTDLKMALLELQAKRDEQGEDNTIADLVAEAVRMLLQHEGISIQAMPVKQEPPPRKPAKSLVKRPRRSVGAPA